MGQACAHCGQVHPAYAQMCPETGRRIGGSFTLVSEDVLLVGSVVSDRWHVKDVIGQGTTGTVFAVDHMGLGRAAAMKVLRPRYASADTLHRVFHGEARAAWLVTHPCITEVLDAGTLPDGAPYFVMERLEGETLAARVARERLSAGAAVDVIMQLLSAIDAIHVRDLLLRDLRPHNVFLAARRGCRPLVKIMDFGIARLVPLEGVRDEWDALRATSEDPEASQGALSIPYHLSPERAARGEHAVERVSDLFVAMVLFYESLTAEKPFTASTFDGVVRAIANAHPPRISDLRPDVPHGLDALLARALASDPRSRPSSARELQEEIRAVFDGAARRGSTQLKAVPVAVPPPPPVVVPPSLVDSAAQTPRDFRDDEPDTHPPSMVSVTSPPAQGGSQHPPQTVASQQIPSLYEEMTSTDRIVDDIARMAVADEASADAPHRTVRPPSEIDIDVEIPAVYDDPQTSRGQPYEDALRAIREDEETETMELTAELRARIEQLARAKAAPAPVAPASPEPKADSSKPPPTRRLR